MMASYFHSPRTPCSVSPGSNVACEHCHLHEPSQSGSSGDLCRPRGSRFGVRTTIWRGGVVITVFRTSTWPTSDPIVHRICPQTGLRTLSLAHLHCHLHCHLHRTS